MVHIRNQRKVGNSLKASRLSPEQSADDRVARQDARLVWESVSRFPISRNTLGEIVLGNNATGSHLARFMAYYEMFEMILLEEADGCSCRGAQQTMNADQYRLFVIAEMMFRLRDLCGDGDAVAALWMPVPGAASCLVPAIEWMPQRSRVA